jgi:hypothetical protein
MTVIVIAAAVILIAGIAWQVRHRRLRSMPDTPDAQFAAYFGSQFGIDGNQAVTERREISQLIGIPKEKLAPETRFAELVSGPLDGTQIGLSDLEFDLSTLAERARIEGRIKMPDTVAGVIRLRMKLKAGQR